jgi:transposase
MGDLLVFKVRVFYALAQREASTRIMKPRMGLKRVGGVASMRNEKHSNLICTPKSGHESVHLFAFWALVIHTTSMSKHIFPQEQIDAMLQTGNVARCSEKSITYHDDFKITAVRRYEQGGTPSEIFRQAGFDLAVIGKKKPKDCLIDWRSIYAAKGEQSVAGKIV